MSVLITGHRGLLGRAFSEALERAGHEVYGIDSGGSGRRHVDARDYFRRGSQSWDLVIHCAAVVGGRQVIDGNPLALAVNLEIDAALFAWALRTRPGRIVYVSSSAAYPAHLQTARDRCHLHESFACADGSRHLLGAPDALYGWAKLTGEMLAHRARAEGLKVTVIRPFSGYSERQSRDYPFSAFAARARAREDPFVIWGTGEQVRDFIHVDDIVAATLAMITEGMDGPVNLATGRPTSMLELAQMFCDAAGYSPQFAPQPDKPQGVAYRVADATAMHAFCKPRVSLEEGIARALRAA